MLQTTIGWQTSDTEEYANSTSFPTEWVVWIIYLDQSDEKLYRWDWTSYEEISPSTSSSLPFTLNEALTAWDLVKIVNDWWIISSITDSRFWTENAFSSSIPTWAAASQLDTNRVFIFYGTEAVVATITAWIISYWTSVDIWWTVWEFWITKIATDKVMLAFTDYSNWLGKIFTIAWSVITYWNTYTFQAGWYMKWIRLCPVWTDKAVIEYSDWSNSFHATLSVWTVAWTVITFWTPVDFLAGEAYDPCLSQLGTDRAFMVYGDNVNWNWRWAVVTIIWTVPTLNTPEIINAPSIEITRCKTIDTDTVLITFLDFWRTKFISWKIATISWVWIVYWALQNVVDIEVLWACISKISATSATISYYTTSAAFTEHLTITWDTIASDAVVQLSSETQTFIGCTPVWWDVVLDIYSSATEWVAKSYEYSATLESVDEAWILQETWLLSESKVVALIWWVSTIHTWLTPWVKQYIQTDWTIWTWATAKQLGRSISTTKINTWQNNL